MYRQKKAAFPVYYPQERPLLCICMCLIDAFSYRKADHRREDRLDDGGRDERQHARRDTGCDRALRQRAEHRNADHVVQHRACDADVAAVVATPRRSSMASAR